MGSVSSSTVLRRASWFAPIAAAALMGAVLVGAGAARNQQRVPDFDGDGRPDLAIWRPPSSGFNTAATFYALTSGTDFSPVFLMSYALGNETDIPLVGDFDGDGKSDFAVYRKDLTYTWFIRLSSQNYTAIATFPWGLEGDTPVAADYDGDGKTDIAVFRKTDGTWYILQAATNFTSAYSVPWGSPNSTPVPGDYDGDGKLDIATVEPNAEGDGKLVWYILQGATRFRSAYAIKMGAPFTTPVPADYDGDGRVDAATYDPATSTFVVRYATSAADSFSRQWGNVGDTPVPADYDGDGKADIAVFRPDAGYFILQAAANFTTAYQRTSGVGSTSADKPVLGR